jgi:hypothetical protein
MTRRWVLIGIICNILANAIFATTAAQMEGASLPPKLIYSIAWLFGPLVIISGVGIFHFLRMHSESVRLELGKLFMTLAGVCITIVVTIRGVALYGFGATAPNSSDQGAYNAWYNANEAIMLVQRGIELSWGIFIYSAAVLFASVMILRGISGRIIGAMGIVICVTGITFDVISWPKDPEAIDLVNMGPFMGLWFVAVAVLMAVQYRRLL